MRISTTDGRAAVTSRSPVWLPTERDPTKPLEVVRRALDSQSFRDLELLPPEPDWLWRGVLAAGSLTMLAGHPFAGKSMLVAGLLKALDEGEPFLGSTTALASALLVTEEDEASLRERARLFGLFGVQSKFVSRNVSVTFEWEELIDRAVDDALRGGHRLLVIDTFPGLAGLADEQENDAGAIGQRLRPLQQAAAKGLAVLFLHHMSSQGQPRGSKAFRGIVDISVRLFRKENSRTIRLELLSRFPSASSPRITAELLKAPDGWFYCPRNPGRSAAAETETAGSTDERLIEALRDAGPDGLRYEDFAHIAGLSEDIAKKRLPDWLGTKVGRRGRGRKNDPYYWYTLAA